MKDSQTIEQQYYWMKVAAKDKFERSLIASTGAAIEIVQDDYVIAYGSDSELKKIQKLGRLVAASNLAYEPLDYPPKDAAFHNYAELTAAMKTLADANPNLVKINAGLLCGFCSGKAKPVRI